MQDKPFFLDDWRRTPKDVQGTIAPKLCYKPAPLHELAGNDLIICAADRRFLERNLPRYLDSITDCSIATAIFLFSPESEIPTIDYLEELNQEARSKRVFIYCCTQPRLSRILSSLTPQSRREYSINYIKSLRYFYALSALSSFRERRNQTDRYVITADLDIAVKSDFGASLRKSYPNSEIIATFNSMGKITRADFPSTLSCTADLSSIKPHTHANRLGLDIPFHVIKGGLALRHTLTGEDLLRRIVLYMHGKKSDPVFTRLFTYYYGDQVAVYLALNDLIRHLKTHNIQVDKLIGWLDYSSSKIASLDPAIDADVCIFKGEGFRNVDKYEAES
ncbi:hypothetical protein CyaNS01_00283 [Cyanobium sp. NS01]|nr:hypothetical protein CyaNS01_00283 [Cyanobium sp. NS01]